MMALERADTCRMNAKGQLVCKGTCGVLDGMSVDCKTLKNVSVFTQSRPHPSSDWCQPALLHWNLYETPRPTPTASPQAVWSILFCWSNKSKLLTCLTTKTRLPWKQLVHNRTTSHCTWPSYILLQLAMRIFERIIQSGPKNVYTLYSSISLE